ncbi:MAG: lysine--tRNA ligase [Deltaproteobacteria bacterium]|nr:lysine--tRNA ligase [Deltaproteobacteria bacterium]
MDNPDKTTLEQVRRQKARRLRERGILPYASGFRVTDPARSVHERYGSLTAEALEAEHAGTRLSMAGRLVALRSFGKTVFLVLRDRSGEIQALVRKNDLAEDEFGLLEDLDLGDHVGVTGPPIRTRTGELSIAARSLVLLTKSVRPLPLKWSTVTDVEIRYRQRYADLACNPDVAEDFMARALIIRELRAFLDRQGFLEVETPMAATLAGGAAARPFLTHHNALDLDLYLRIAPELYLKRLIVGGLERVYEIGKMFRNEGISTRHNPEFTMLEFYMAYATYEDLMDLTEALLCHVDERLCEAFPRYADGRTFRLARPFRRIAMKDAVVHRAELPAGLVDDEEGLRRWHVERHPEASPADRETIARMSHGTRIFTLFEEIVEPSLGHDPVFVVDFPLDVSPLSRKKETDGSLVDRFELYIEGRELSNAFTELNDPDDQAERFRAQVEAKRRGDEEAMDFDEDYVRALEYGMPPPAGLGLGIDRLVMLLCGKQSIRDVILFPLMKPEE